jgi:outer membrane lipoprotein-sorting protein
MESTGFALLPRQGLNFSTANILKDEYTAILAKEDVIDGNDVYLIKILPLSDSSQVILSTLWIDKEKYVVYKIETTTKSSGTVGINLSYSEQEAHALPSRIVISFKVEQMNLPPGMTGEFEANQETQKDGPMTGTVTVEYQNYKVNQGLSDEFFEEENPKSDKK